MGGVMYGITSWAIDSHMAANMIPAEFGEDFHRLFDPLMGSAGGDIVNVISNLIWERPEKESE